MITEYLDIAGKWNVVVCYDIKPLDEYKMRQLMMALGVKGEELEESIDTLMHLNTGMTITSMKQRMSLVFIGNATGNDQWWDTLAHEIFDHVKVAICDYYGVSLHGEDSAWLTGFLMRKVVQIIAEPCR